jgi:glycosyltransferase involved in cell wall biosynthesis
MDIKVSVVMPVYNAEKYLAKSIESMLSQTLKEIELILVNDGSKDNSLKICEEYKNKDNRVTVINKKNEGACIARNTGIEKAKGKYIQLVDADDYIENNMLEEQYNLAEKTNAEVVMCGMKFDIHQKNGQVVTSESHYKDMVLDSQDEIKPIFMDLFDNLLFNYTHNKLYNAQFLKSNNLKFIDWLPIDQDTNFNIDVFKKLNKLTISTKSYYHYVKTFEETIVTRYHANKFKVRTFRYDRLKQLLMDWGIYNEENRKKLASMYIHHVIECFEIYNHEKCNLSVSDKKREIGKILDTEQVKECIKVLDKTNSFYTNMIFKQMKGSRINGIYSIAKLKRVLR